MAQPNDHPDRFNHGTTHSPESDADVNMSDLVPEHLTGQPYPHPNGIAEEADDEASVPSQVQEHYEESDDGDSLSSLAEEADDESDYGNSDVSSLSLPPALFGPHDAMMPPAPIVFLLAPPPTPRTPTPSPTNTGSDVEDKPPPFELQAILACIKRLAMDFYDYCVREGLESGVDEEDWHPSNAVIHHFQVRLRELVGFEMDAPVLTDRGQQLFGHLPSSDLAAAMQLYKNLLQIEYGNCETRIRFLRSLKEVFDHCPGRAKALQEHRQALRSEYSGYRNFAAWLRDLDFELLDYFLGGALERAPTEVVRQRRITTSLVIFMDQIASVCNVEGHPRLTSKGQLIFGNVGTCDLRLAVRHFHRYQAILRGYGDGDRAFHLAVYCTEPDVNPYYRDGLLEFRARRNGIQDAAGPSGGEACSDSDICITDKSDDSCDQPQPEHGTSGEFHD